MTSQPEDQVVVVAVEAVASVAAVEAASEVAEVVASAEAVAVALVEAEVEIAVAVEVAVVAVEDVEPLMLTRLPTPEELLLSKERNFHSELSLYNNDF